MFNQSFQNMKGKTTFLAKAFIMLFAVLCSFSVARADEVTIGSLEGAGNDSYLPMNSLYNYSYTQQIYTADEIGTAGTINAITVWLYGNADLYETPFDIYMVETDKEAFASTIDWVEVTSGDIVYTGTIKVNNTEAQAYTFELDSPFSYSGSSNLVVCFNNRCGQWKSGLNGMVFGADTDPKRAIYARRDDSVYDPTAMSSITAYGTTYKRNVVTFDITQGEGPTVAKPKNVTITYTGGTEATVAWESTETAFDIEVNGTVTENVSNPTTLTGLDFATTYAVKVRAKNGTDVSDWTAPKSFTTDISDDMCQIQLVLSDQWGDGWNGNAIKIVDVLTGIVIGTYTNVDLNGTNSNGENEENILYAEVPDDRDIQFVWEKGSYPTETSWVITDVNGEVILEGAGTSAMATGDVLGTYHVECTVTPWRAPSNLTASEVGPRSAKLSWTENSLTPATAWVVAFKAEGETEFGEEDADSNPYVLAGLSPETKYIVKVRPATDEVEKWSEEITFTTDVAFPAPTDVAVSDVTATTATITWAGDADSYNLRYRTSVPTKATITLTAGDVWGDGSGYQMLLDADATAYGDVFTANSGWTATDFSAFEYTIPTNAECDMNTSAIVFNNSVSIRIPAGTYDWCILNPSPGDMIYIAAANGSAGGRADDYEFEAGKTYEFVPAIFGNNDGIDVTITGEDYIGGGEIGEWVVINNVTSPYTIEGLTPDQFYDVEVQAVYDTDESSWAGTDFITLEDFPTPTDLAVSEIGPKTAVLSWTENGEATAWEICLNDDETALIAADDNTFTLTGLTPETDYTVKVRAVNGEKKSKWSKAESFTTDIATPAPTDVAVSDITSSTASISWTGFGESYNLRYREYSPGAEFVTDFEDSSMNGWTTIDADGDGNTWVLGSAAGGIYIQEGGSLAGTGRDSSQDLIVSGSYSNVTGALTPDNYLVSPQITLGGSISFYACAQDASYAAEHFGVAVSTSGNTDASDFTTIKEWTMTSAGTPGATAPKDQGTWGLFTVDLSAYAGQTGYVAIRHFNCTDMFLLDIDDITIEQPSAEGKPWIEVANVTSPHALEGLTPETKYEVAVQGVYPEGAGQWSASTIFTTLKTNPVPYDIAADLVADGATLTWKGEGESYNLRYRTAAFTDASFFDSFNNGLDQWTIYTEGEGDGWIIGSDAGVNAAEAYSYDSNTSADWAADNWLVTPRVNLRGTLEYNDVTSSDYPDTYEVLLSLTGNSIADFNNGIVLREMAAASSTGSRVSIDLSNYEGQQGYIAFHHVSTGMSLLVIAYPGIYGDGDVAEGEWQTMTVTDPTATISGLDTNNAYEVQIQSVQGTDESEWSDAFEFALLSLDSNADNNAALLNYGGMLAHVTLANRTLYQDGTWNTLCLPFSLDADALAASPLAGADFRTLESIDANDVSVTLNFSAQGDYDDLGIVGSYPWIVKWESGSNIVNPQFANVTLYSNRTSDLSVSDATTGYGVTFKGTYAKQSFANDDPSILFVGADNKLNYPLAGASVGAFRGYFTLEGFTMEEGGGVKIFTNLDDEDATSIANVETVVENTDWYDLSGRKLAGKPSMKGIYVNGGRKVTVK